MQDPPDMSDDDDKAVAQLDHTFECCALALVDLAAQFEPEGVLTVLGDLYAHTIHLVETMDGLPAEGSSVLVTQRMLETLADLRQGGDP